MSKTTNIELILRDCIAGRISKRDAADELSCTRMTLYRKLNKLIATGSVEHGLIGRPSNNKCNPNKDNILSLVGDKYYDCGPTLASEFLDEYDGIVVHPECLRLWMHEGKLMVKTRNRKPYRQRRVRKPCFNDMLQIDGSFHNWFGDKKSCMMNIIDDATGIDLFRFDEQETLESACLLLWDWCKRYGIPKSIYSDRRNMYIPKDEGAVNYFTMMCKNLGIRRIPANSAQAKGRVERSNGVHQDRLIPRLRLEGIVDIESANELVDKYLSKHNKKFSVGPESREKTFKILDKRAKLMDYCYIEDKRKVSNDWVISYGGKKYQLKRYNEYYCPSKSTVFVREYLDGAISIFYRNNVIPFVTF